MKLIIADVESPYSAKTDDLFRRNILYARMACRWSLLNGYCPYASHLFFTQPGILDDDKPNERTLGINAGKLLIRDTATHTLVFQDLGISSGMEFGIEHAKQYNRTLEYFSLFNNDVDENTSYQSLLNLGKEQGYITDNYERLGW